MFGKFGAVFWAQICTPQVSKKCEALTAAINYLERSGRVDANTGRHWDNILLDLGIFLESLIPSGIFFLSSITAAAITGPASGPLPTSSIPAMGKEKLFSKAINF